MRLAEYLSKHGQTLTAFAAEIDANVPTVHGWVSGRRKPRASALAAIERATKGKVRASDFVGDEEEPRK